MEMQSTLLKDVAPACYTWKVVVRLARVWEYRDKRTGDLYELNFVVVDREGGIMEGVVPKERIDQYKKILKEGSVYTIQYFGFYNVKKVYRAADHAHRMVLTCQTKIEEINPPHNFPVFAYNALPFTELAKRDNDNTLLSDVVGKVTAVSRVTTTTNSNQPRRHIYITDGRQRVVVTLWNEQALAFDADRLHGVSKNEHVFVLFVGMTVGEYLKYFHN